MGPELPSSSQPTNRDRAAWAALYDALPILVPCACVGLVLLAIAIGEVRRLNHRADLLANRPEASTALPTPPQVKEKPPAETRLVVDSSAPDVPREVDNAAPQTPPPPAIAEAALPADEEPRQAPPERTAAEETSEPFDEDAIFKKLREAKSQFRDTVAADLQRIVSECEEIAKREASATGNLSLARELLKEVAELKESGTIPTGPQFEAPRKSHLEARRSAARELYGAYKETVDSLVKNLALERAINVKDEMDEFVAKERQVLGVIDAAKPGQGQFGRDQPLLMDLQADRQTREYPCSDPAAKVALTITELANFPEGTKVRGDATTAPAGKVLVIEFASIAGPRIEVRCLHNSGTSKIQLRVEPIFEEVGNRQFELTFSRLSGLEVGTKANLERVQNEIQMLARPRRFDAFGNVIDPGGEIIVARESLRALQAQGYGDAPSEQNRKAAIVRHVNYLDSLSKRLDRAQREVPKLTARLSAVPKVRDFMESIHQKAMIKYTISLEREGGQLLLVDAQ
jgi:hypothetical protein